MATDAGTDWAVHVVPPFDVAWRPPPMSTKQDVAVVHSMVDPPADPVPTAIRAVVQTAPASVVVAKTGEELTTPTRSQAVADGQLMAVTTAGAAVRADHAAPPSVVV